MADNPFVKATKENLRLRMAITGPSGSGKTYTALTLATVIGKTAVLDTERGSAKKYADRFDFDVLEIDVFSPSRYIRAIERAVEFGYEVIVLDSLSHAWAGIGGVLDIVEQQKKKETNKFAAWSKGTDEQNKLIEAILGSGLHVIGTMRSKTEYVIGDDKKPIKVGMAPVQRDGFEYEFDIIGAMDMENDMVIEKTRCSELTGRVISKPDGALAKTLIEWLSDGVEPAPYLTDEDVHVDETGDVILPPQGDIVNGQKQPPAAKTAPPARDSQQAQASAPGSANDDFPTIRSVWPDMPQGVLSKKIADLPENFPLGGAVYARTKTLGYADDDAVKAALELGSIFEWPGTVEALLNRVIELANKG